MFSNVSNLSTNVQLFPNFTILSNVKASFFHFFKKNNYLFHLDSKIILKNIIIHNYAIPSALSIMTITFFIFINNYPKPLKNEKKDIYFKGMHQIIRQQNQMINSKFIELKESNHLSISNELSTEYNELLNDFKNPNGSNKLFDNRIIISKLHLLSSKLFNQIKNH